MSDISLTFVTSTRNKLPYLKETYKDLIANVQSDEEIIVGDGGSTDGTPQYLNELLTQKKISGFISEADKGESHALNKLFLMAKGELITLVTDDDAFDFEAIEACKKFMLEHPEVDIISTNGGFKGQNNAPVRDFNNTELFQQWLANHTPFMSCGLGIMFRRSSLPLLGMWDVNFRRADAEYLFRVTAGPANIAWFTGRSYVNVSTPQSVSVVFRKRIEKETERLEQFYLDKKPKNFIIKKCFALFYKIRGYIKNKPASKPEEPVSNKPAHEIWKPWYDTAKQWLKETNKTQPGEFLYKK